MKNSSYNPHHSSAEIGISKTKGNPPTSVCTHSRNAVKWTHFQTPLQWRHNERDGVSNPQPHECLLNRLIKAQIKGNIKTPRHWLCEGNSPVTGEFPAQRTCSAEKVSIWWRHHDILITIFLTLWYAKILKPSLFKCVEIYQDVKKHCSKFLKRERYFTLVLGPLLTRMFYDRRFLMPHWRW